MDGVEVSDITVRWMVPKDQSRVVELFNQCHEAQMTVEDLCKMKLKQTFICMVAEATVSPPARTKIVGAMMYDVGERLYRIGSLFVDPVLRRHGIGTALITRLASKKSQIDRTGITATLRDDCYEGHAFLRANHFVGRSTPIPTTYIFERDLKRKFRGHRGEASVNRVRRYFG